MKFLLVLQGVHWYYPVLVLVSCLEYNLTVVNSFNQHIRCLWTPGRSELADGAICCILAICLLLAGSTRDHCYSLGS